MKLSLQDLLAREQVIKAVRAFFDNKGFHEVITPVLNTALPLEENLFSFKTTWARGVEQETLYLPTSPESNLKKLLAQGIGNCYSIGHSFRNLEDSGSLHSPEFLMLEWYREDATYIDIMRDTKELINYVGLWVSRSLGMQITNDFSTAFSADQWPMYSLEILFQEKAGITLEDACEGDRLLSLAKTKGYSVEGASWSQVFDQMFLNEIEPHLSKEPFFLVDFPARMSPLCTIQKDKPYLAERFEFYMNGIEIGNGNTENLDAEYVQSSFEQVLAARNKEGKTVHPYDSEFIEALRTLQKTGKSYAGIGLGVERLALLLQETSL